jgi:hypothetical protein
MNLKPRLNVVVYRIMFILTTLDVVCDFLCVACDQVRLPELEKIIPKCQQGIRSQPKISGHHWRPSDCSFLPLIAAPL